MFSEYSPQFNNIYKHKTNASPILNDRNFYEMHFLRPRYDFLMQNDLTFWFNVHVRTAFQFSFRDTIRIFIAVVLSTTKRKCVHHFSCNVLCFVPLKYRVF